MAKPPIDSVILHKRTRLFHQTGMRELTHYDEWANPNTVCKLEATAVMHYGGREHLAVQTSFLGEEFWIIVDEADNAVRTAVLHYTHHELMCS